MSREHDPEILSELFDHEMPIDEEDAELTVARLDWYMHQDSLALILFLEQLEVEKSIILAVLQFVQDCNKDNLESLEITLQNRLPDPREPIRHPELDEIQQTIGGYAMTDIKFSFSDFVALLGVDVHPDKFEQIPHFARDILDERADQIISGDDYTDEILAVRALSVSEIIHTLTNPVE